MGSKRKPQGSEPIQPKPTLQNRPTRKELYASGKKLREKCSRESHAIWKASRARRNPIDLIHESNQGRIAQLIPIRHGRMLQSPFAYYRGTALNLAADLAATPVSGLHVQESPRKSADIWERARNLTKRSPNFPAAMQINARKTTRFSSRRREKATSKFS